MYSIPEETMASIIREMERVIGASSGSRVTHFWFPFGPPQSVALQCNDCGLYGADVRSRYNQDPARCDVCHKRALLDKAPC